MSSDKDKERLKREADLLSSNEFSIDPQLFYQMEQERRKNAKEQAHQLNSFLSKQKDPKYLVVLGEGTPQQLMDIKSPSNLTEKVTDLSVENSELPAILDTLHEEGIEGDQRGGQNSDLVFSIGSGGAKHLRANSLPIGLGLGTGSQTTVIALPHTFPCTSKYTIRISNSLAGTDEGFTVLEQLDLNVTCKEILEIYFAKQSASNVNRHLFVLKNGREQQKLQLEDRPIVIQNQWLQEFGFHPSEPEFFLLGSLDFGFYFQFFVARSPLSQPWVERAINADSVDGHFSVDLASKNLFKIPNQFFTFASQISAVDLTRNRMFNLSTEFCKSCTNLNKFVAACNSIDQFPFGLVYFSGTLTWLDLGMNYLREDTMDLLGRLVNLQVLMLNCNRLKSLPASFGQLKNLKILNMSNNFMQTIPDCFFELKELVHLDLSYNLINNIPGEIGSLTKLRVLNLENNLIKMLPQEMKELTCLKRLTMTYNLINSIENLAGMPSLFKLSLDHTRIKEANIANQQLEFISICESHLCKISLQQQLARLSMLLLEYGKISSLPEDFFAACPSLKYLSMKNNLLTALPSSFETLEQIEYVDLSNNQLDSITISPNLSKLHTLLLNNNNLKTLPSSVWLLKGLQKLSLSSNTIYTLPQPSGPIMSLKELYLQENLLNNSVCYLFCNLPSIRLLNLSFNPKISQLYDIHLLPNLTHLYLSGIGLPNVPAGIGALSKLQALHLDMNQIISVPNELGECSTLRFLDLANNRLNYNVKNFPYDWNWTLNSSLEYLDLSGNADFWIQRIVPTENPFDSMPNLRHVNVTGVARIDDAMSAVSTCSDPLCNGKQTHRCIDCNSVGCSESSIGPPLANPVGAGPKCATRTKIIKSSPSAQSITDSSCSFSLGLAHFFFETSGQAQISKASGYTSATNFNVAMFDGAPEVVSFLVNNFDSVLSLHLNAPRLREGDNSADSPHPKVNSVHGASEHDVAIDVPLAIRKTFLECNRRLCLKLTETPPSSNSSSNWSSKRSKSVQNPNLSVLTSSLDSAEPGSCDATVPRTLTASAKFHLKSSASGIFVSRINETIYCANVGSCKAVLSRAGRAISVSSWDSIKNPQELWRLRHIGSNIDKSGCVNGITKVAKQLGDPANIPFICGCPSIYDVQVDPLNDEFIIVASKGLWNVLSNQLAVDLVQKERANLQCAARKLRDFAFGYDKIQEPINVCIIGLQNTHSSNAILPDSSAAAGRASRSPSSYALDSPMMDVSLARLDTEISPPIGDVTLVFTDIKGSTTLWSHADKAMKQALRIHNRIMRRLLRTIGGYEVKTEGDAFMVAFGNPKQAIKWCMQVQTELLVADWPSEIFNVQEARQPTGHADAPSLYRGLSVRMGVHVGQPVCELDPVTLRMDYFGLEVTVAARIRDLADGGQLFATQPIYDAISQLKEPADRKQLLDPVFVPLGTKQLKGIKNELPVYAVYPQQLRGRHECNAQPISPPAMSPQSVHNSLYAIDDTIFEDLLRSYALFASSLGLSSIVLTPTADVPVGELKNSDENLPVLLDNFARLERYYNLTLNGKYVDLFAKYEGQLQISRHPELFRALLDELASGEYFSR